MYSTTQIVMETVSDSTGELYTLVYLYDEAGAPIGMKYRTPTYSPGVFDCFFFEKNLQGDIVAVYDSNGTEIATYVYTAWGECTMSYTSSTANSPGLKNPFKYRGYYHDSETGWYYLNSRYYNPSWGRFISVDAYISTGQGIRGYNAFAYCRNEPVFRKDTLGTTDVCVETADEDDNPLNDLGVANGTGNGGGGNANGSGYGGRTGGYGGGNGISGANTSTNATRNSAQFPSNESQLKHIFRNAKGHIPDTPPNRQLLLDTTSPEYYLGNDKYNNSWYARTLNNGSQVWVETRNNVIWDGGINMMPRPWNQTTGLKP